ncbi:hypothetical protein MKW11_09470 [Gluconobacter frateurii]|uniref:hypothetical protein n=1 Tax=Gluconobacter frateurii TaxID=38308 RepID=UPI001F05E3FA|nr:hypothetical protein [Gluconobacter frateurii]UMM07454.1 hypothetical protein MKW11_09470 [Gluconobacter frateurii]
MAAARVKVLKVQRITFGLGESRGVELRSTNLEFQNACRIRGNEDSVDPVAQTGNGEFEQDLPACGLRQSGWRGAEKIKLGGPGTELLRLAGEAPSPGFVGEALSNAIRVRIEERGDWAGPPRSH